MLIQGGTISSGRSRTLSVVGVYWMSCRSSFWKTTLPGVVARLRPSSKALGSVWLIFIRSPDRFRSSASRLAPFSRLRAFDAIVSRSTSGLVARKFVGEIGARQLPQIELGAVTLARIEIGRRGKLVFGPFAGEQISLLQEIKERIAGSTRGP